MRRLWPLLFSIVSLFGFAGPASACSCALVDPDQMLEFGPVAFVGTVTGGPALVGAGGSAVFTFDVETVLAGEVPALVEVTTAANSAACGLEAALGTRMAIFAVDEGNGVFSSNLCSTTDADLAIQALGPGNPPGESGAPMARDAFDWQAVWLGTGGLAVVVAVWLAGGRRG